LSLIVPPFRFANCTDTLTGAGSVPASTHGVAFSAGANNADQSVVSLLQAALTHDVHYLVIGIGGISLTNANSNALADIVSDPAGGTTWGSFIDDLACGYTGAVGTSTTLGVWYHFPVFIKAGTSLGIRCRTAHTVDITTGMSSIYCYGNPTRPDMWWCGSKVETLGATPASSNGTAIPAGASSAFGAWTTVGTSTGRYGAIQLGINGTDASALGVGYWAQLGAGSAQLAGTPNYYFQVSTNEVMGREGMQMPVFCDVPEGTTIQARAAGSAGTVENVQMSAYGVY
jgi:hypothetical protein